MLQDLEARWRDERTPQAGVRLAEALHRQGERIRAEGILSVVEERLGKEPRDLASRVAVGAQWLGLGRPADAARVLEHVVQADPTHLKANKLLVEVYLELGQRDRARDRLDLYRLLNEGDPEIDSLEGLVVGIQRPAPPPVVITAMGERRLRLAGGDPFAALTDQGPPPAAGGLLELLPAAGAAPPDATATLGALYQEQGHRDDAERMFRDVLTREPDNERARDALAALAGPAEVAAPVAAAGAAEAGEESDRHRRIGLLRDYLARIQRGRGAVSR